MNSLSRSEDIWAFPSMSRHKLGISCHWSSRIQQENLKIIRVSSPDSALSKLNNDNPNQSPLTVPSGCKYVQPDNYDISIA